jgi:aminoglycoside phosphotransferase (APT) family kinase protein
VKVDDGQGTACSFALAKAEVRINAPPIADAGREDERRGPGATPCGHRQSAEIHGHEHAARPEQQETRAGDVARAADVPAGRRDAARARLATLPRGPAVCPGDFHPLNVIIADERLWIVDWSKATRGHPDADVARTVMLLRLTNVPSDAAPAVRQAIEQARATFLAGYVAAYVARRPVTPVDVMPWMLPIAVARLAREISDNERQQLLALGTELAQGGVDPRLFT